MNIAIESHALNYPSRSGLMTYTEGLVNGMVQLDKVNQYSLLYYSLLRKPMDMPGPAGTNSRKFVLKVPDSEFKGRQSLIDKVILPIFFKTNKISIFHRTCGYSMPKTKGIYRILTVHDLRTLTIGDNHWKQNIESYKKTILGLDLCVVVSECTKKDLIEHLNIPDNKIKVIYLGADKRFKPSSAGLIQSVRQKYGLQGPFLFSVGSVPRKNIEGIIRSFARSKAINDHQLVLGCGLDVDKYHLLAKELDIADKVVILPKLDDQDVVELYSACHAFVFPSLYEGFGLPILEAMQCGAPVITSNNSSCPEVAGDAAILVDPNNIEQISDAINQVCDDPSLRSNLVTKGFLRAADFSWERFAKEMLHEYSMALRK